MQSNKADLHYLHKNPTNKDFYENFSANDRKCIRCKEAKTIYNFFFLVLGSKNAEKKLLHTNAWN